jgi:outer membrane receptor protein involved in Fe transport
VDPDGFRRFQFGGGVGGPLVDGRTFLFTALEFTDEREDRIGSTAQTDFLGTELRSTVKAFGLDHGWSPDPDHHPAPGPERGRAGRAGGGVIVPEADITTVRRGTLVSLTHRSALRGGDAANEFSVQFGTFRWDFPPSESDLDTPQVTIVGPDLTTVEAVVGSSNFIFDESERQFQLANVFETRLGDATPCRLGADLLHSRFELLGANTNPRGAYTVVNEGNIRASGPFVSISDIPRRCPRAPLHGGREPQQVNLGQTLVGAFVENRWRPRADLTVLAGLRWDYDDITSRGESEPDLDNLQPRISVNWLPTPGPRCAPPGGSTRAPSPTRSTPTPCSSAPRGTRWSPSRARPFPPRPSARVPRPPTWRPSRARSPRGRCAACSPGGSSSPVEPGHRRMGREFAAHWGLSVDGLWVESRNLPRSWDLNALERPVSPPTP